MSKRGQRMVATTTSERNGGTALSPPPEAVADDGGQGVPRREHRRWDRWATLLALGFVAFLFALPLRGLLRVQGSPMEEGFMLVFPERVLEGDLPNRDFLHLYGPGSLWVLAGAFWTFGTTLFTERVVGLLQHVGLVLGLFALARPWGRAVATSAAAVCLLVIIPPTALTALAWNGALALGVWALWAALRARRSPPETAGRWALLAGVLAGLTILYRPDLVVATTLGVGAALWGVERLRLRRFAVGAALGLAPYLIHLATAGVGNSVQGMLLDPVFRLRGGRSLPIPPSPSELVGFLQLSGETYLFEWPLPTLTTAQQIALWFWLVFVINAVLVGVGVWRVRTDRRSVTARIVLAVALFSLGMLPQAVQRTDSTHFAWATAVGLGFLPVAVAELLGRIAPRRRPALRSLVAGGLVLLLLAVAIPNFTFLRYADLTAQTFGSHRLSFPVSREGRNFYYGRRDAAKALRTLLPDLERVAAPGDRLFVGTSDLRKTPYSDAFLYHLFPELDPATRYIEMDPGVANEEGSGLAEDLASADVAVLSRIWNDWNEPNDSRVVGSDESNRVLEDQFRLERAYGGTDTGPGQSFASAANRDRFNVLFELWVRREPRSGG